MTTPGLTITSMDELARRSRVFWRRRDIRAVVALWAVMTVVLVIFSSYVPQHLMGSPASSTMRTNENTMTFFSEVASPVAAMVWAIAVYSLLAWRHRGVGPPETDGPAQRGNRAVGVIWILVSSVLCIFLLIWGLAAIPSVDASASAKNAMVVNVTGQQWVWNFTYPEQGGVQSDQLYLPVHRPVAFRVTSKDVVHSFWVVQFGIKIDANPGSVTRTSVTPDKLGTFNVRCAELCGLLHAEMETNAHVVTAKDFASWVSANGGHGS